MRSLRKTISKRKKDFCLVGIIILSSILLHLSLLNNFYVSDDLWYLDMGKLVSQDPTNLVFGDQVSNANFRPMAHIVNLIVYRISNLNPIGYAISSILFHSLNSVIIFFIALLIFKKRSIAFVAGILFAVNSTHSDAVIWFAAIHALILSFFYFLTLLFFILYLKDKDKNKVFYFLSLLFCIFTFLTKETSATIVLMLFLCDLLIFRNSFRIDWNMVKRYIPFVVINIFYLVFQFFYQKTNIQIVSSNYKIGIHIISNIIQYFVSFILGFPQINFILKSNEMFLQNFPALQSLLIFLKVVVILLMFLVPIAIIILMIKGSNIVRFLILWIMITVLPVSLLTLDMASRHAYLPSLGFVLLVSYLIHTMPQIKSKLFTHRIKLGIIIFLVLIYSSFTCVNERVFEGQGEVTRGILLELQELHASFPDNSTLYFINLPFHLSPGDEKTHITQLVQLFYDNPSLLAEGITEEEAASLKTQEKIFLFKIEDGIVKEINDFKK